MPSDPSDEDLQFVKQLGVEYVNIGTGGDRATYENFVRLRQKVEAAGLKVWNIGNSNVHNMEEVTLNLPGRDKKIEEYKTYLRNLGESRHLLYHLGAHGQRDLEYRAGIHPGRGGRTGTAYSVGYIKALLERVNAEARG